MTSKEALQMAAQLNADMKHFQGSNCKADRELVPELAKARDAALRLAKRLAAEGK